MLEDKKLSIFSSLVNTKLEDQQSLNLFELNPIQLPNTLKGNGIMSSDGRGILFSVKTVLKLFLYLIKEY